MNKDTKDFIEQWLIKANDDLLVINRLMEGSIIAGSAICFHSQQLVEKVLKAYLISNGKELRKTHNIEYLLSECADFDEEFNQIDAKNLSDFGVEIRYPGDIYQPSDEEAIEYSRLAKEIKEFTERKIRKLIDKD